MRDRFRRLRYQAITSRLFPRRKKRTEKLTGTTTGPDGTAWQWTGVRAPDLKRKNAPAWGKPVQLFDGKDLKGWTPSDPNATAKWTVEDGTLVSPGHGAELI